jgi:four helix bundle protein
MKTQRFRDLLVWQRSMKLASDIYILTRDFPRSELFGLTAQLCRAAVSVPSNIAEGHGRLTDRGFAAFIGQARGSLYEIETQLELARSFGCVGAEKVNPLLAECAEIGKMINGLLNKLSESNP